MVESFFYEENTVFSLFPLQRFSGTGDFFEKSSYWKKVKEQKKFQGINFNTKIPPKYFFGRVFSKTLFQLKFFGTGKNGWMIFGSFFGFFFLFNIGDVENIEKWLFFDQTDIIIYACNSQFLGPLFDDLLDAKGHFSCFLQKVLFMGENQKKVFFSILFFFKKIQKFTVFSLKRWAEHKKLARAKQSLLQKVCQIKVFLMR